MAEGKFETPRLDLHGEILKAEILDVTGIPPQDVIEAGRPFQVHVQWELTGSAVPMLCGEWHLKVLFEEQGGDYDGHYPAMPMRIPLHAHSGRYDQTITLRRGLPATDGGSVYRIIATLSYVNAAGRPGLMGGEVDCGLISVLPARRREAVAEEKAVAEVTTTEEKAVEEKAVTV